ncbi:PREDICTED: mucin-5AC [Bactrocera latifrons]|uniref:mucin-5AC n=1 Tax=Bactrocera latifrons TaxID=174628 RepID=UPI0008DDEB78|nr:PREDICTED: mucin-5AC [Bactrocera latifrons]XP_018800418.1 PREDICTED: mucin-5AC [Bactrocera latifrons]XP_018800419.1 PREDICTED: mucin-5AC [Bactrocera latifrons]
MSLHSVAPLQFWLVILLGLSHFGTRTEARAVNVSNTWTMPQEGLNVFYRFFRDRISWFEADAVCQFHHANLVTVDNSFQFDATRDLLRELDVNDIVWIGLMRPQSSDRFMWSNSRPLVTDTGYWAESLPLMDAPLCAVIDPIRDYRWHALRCGGPETASFLCEMPVPSWADSCILKDMPNLTMQYMADTASIELIRNCAEEGLLKQSCKGKQDRDRALRELICPRERLEAQRINDITNSHFKSLQIINSIRTDNNENNDIELLPLGETSYGSASSSDISEQVPTEKNTVQRLIEQFNVDDLMQADEAAVPMSIYHIPGEIPKPVKKAAKKVIITNGGEYQKKIPAQKYDEGSIQLPPPTPKPKKQQQLLALEDMMMGDQPQQSGEPEMLEHMGPEDDEVSNEIMEPLPHKKKVLPQDLRTMTPITEKSSDEMISREKPAHKAERMPTFETTSAPTTTTSSSTTLAPTTTTTTTITTTTTSTTAAASSSAASSTTIPDFVSSTTATEVKISTAETTQEPAAATTLHASSATSAHTIESETLTHSSSTSSSSSVTTHAAPKSIDVEDTESLSNIGHPMHPQQQHANSKFEELPHPHVKELADNSHFIPPMLLVKSHYVPPPKHNEHEHHSGSSNVGSAAHDGRGDIHVTTGKPIEGTVHSSSTSNYTPTETTHSHTMAEKSAETDVETMTTITVTATMAAIKAATTKTTTAAPAASETTTNIDGLTGEAIDKSTLPAQLTAQIIDSTSAAKTNQHQPQQKQQQQQKDNDKPNNMKRQAQAASEEDEITEKIENAKEVVVERTTTATKSEETTTTTAPITTVAANVNKQHATATAETITTTVKAPATTTTKTDDNASRHEIEKPVKRGPQTKEMSMLTTNVGTEDMPATTTKTITTTTSKPTTAQTDKLHTIKPATATQKPPQQESTKTTTAATTIAEGILRNNDNAENVRPSSQSILATADAATNAPTASSAASAFTSAATVTPSTHTITITTACSSDTYLDATTADTLDASSTTEDTAAGKKLTRVHRTCQPRIEKTLTHKGKHTKHHAVHTIEPPTPTRNFLKEETETPPYKPNRHRVLTKPETVSYFKKILG